MRVVWIIVLGVVILAGVGAASFPALKGYWDARSRPNYREGEVARGPITSVVNSTGTVQPIVSVQIGSFVSGPIKNSYVDFNSQVKKGDVLAKIDPRTYEANVARDKAALATRRAEAARVTAVLQQAKNDEKRSQDLRASQKEFISDTEMDQFHFSRQSLEAQLQLAEAAIEEATAALALSKANLDYTIITSPVDGVVIDRKIDPGQTVAATFTTPVLFIVAPEMDKKMFVYASVDEADIGQVRAAKERGEPAFFAVEPYPDDLFQGTIAQVRLNPTTVQNVVTYTVVVEAPNAELKLLPGMTANLSFQIEKHDDCLKVPNAALRFYPKSITVRPEDRELLEGSDQYPTEGQSEAGEIRRSADDKVSASRNRARRHVWVQDGEFLRAVEIVTGLSDSNFTEVVSGKLNVADKLVTGIRPPTAGPPGP